MDRLLHQNAPEYIEPGTTPAWCYVLHSLALYTTLSNYAWMLGEGIFLHFSLTNVFSERKRLLTVCCVIGWVVPAVIILMYCVIRISIGEDESDRCWLNPHPLNWIVFIPIMISLLLNLIFLINIVRILFSKMRSVNQRNFEQYKKTVRAVLILIPLLGLQYILMPLKIDSFLYQIVTAIITSYQGALTAVLFCFLNGEVVLLIKRKTCHWCSRSTRETGTSKRIKEYDANDAHAHSEEMEIFVSAHPCVV
uniref:Calcitonin gene-related peptide type 1 receptor-like n=1 Tax=Crassostrea virginica TaxID=6565 RepID=A0A8B8C1F5_CRAVI|nr:calcitonin gene-related peptide type 1 receptor-like [Crassostrea virginica]XP_022309487.1 calcitonin gene-related peptide type 1 receptor-like [Crassostrea virginica]XP_022309488.1 calcitonin gene-related peptide type 1 receptor-like [Crassostrea virginica]XP_022309489.1 calcitonin gene-related peptide type 1 receptor-like [Crassostrea virginica]